jgi:hypothetical protein
MKGVKGITIRSLIDLGARVIFASQSPLSHFHQISNHYSLLVEAIDGISTTWADTAFSCRIFIRSTMSKWLFVTISALTVRVHEDRPVSRIDCRISPIRISMCI